MVLCMYACQLSLLQLLIWGSYNDTLPEAICCGLQTCYTVLLVMYILAFSATGNVLSSLHWLSSYIIHTRTAHKHTLQPLGKYGNNHGEIKSTKVQNPRRFCHFVYLL